MVNIGSNNMTYNIRYINKRTPNCKWLKMSTKLNAHSDGRNRSTIFYQQFPASVS